MLLHETLLGDGLLHGILLLLLEDLGHLPDLILDVLCLLLYLFRDGVHIIGLVISRGKLGAAIVNAGFDSKEIRFYHRYII
jgi:hypothetical protein